MTFDSGSSNMSNFKVSVSIEDIKSSIRLGTKEIFTHTHMRSRARTHTKKHLSIVNATLKNSFKMGRFNQLKFQKNGIWLVNYIVVEV